jgi:mono/diheme cytochrome c family protein
MMAGQFKLAVDEIDHTAVAPASVTPAITAEYGKYMASTCIGCHGPNMSGGKIPGAPPDWPAAANLTAHPSASLANWNEDQFITAIRTRQRPDGTTLSPVMPAAFAQMNDVELKAIWTYIRTLPPVPKGHRS